MLELSAELDKFKYDLFCLNETWMRPDTPSRLLVTPGYQLLRADRPDGRGYGGVDSARPGRDVCVTRVKVAGAPHPGSRLETLWTLVKPDGKRRLILGSVYRPTQTLCSGSESRL